MSPRFIVGLAGGIGSGKSAASRWFEQQGITVVDADIVAREVVMPNQPALTKIRDAFGDWVIQEDGHLDRKALRNHIFTQPDARKVLENITHPIIRESIITQLQTAHSAYVILVSPLLFETQQHLLTQRTLLIDASEALQIQRATERDQQSSAQIQNIIAAQMSRTQKQSMADDIVSNDLDLDHLYSQLQSLHRQYLQLAQANE